jgi:hypothetical protein
MPVATAAATMPNTVAAKPFLAGIFFMHHAATTMTIAA